MCSDCLFLLSVVQVHCWNEANGCDAILSASRIAEHVRHDCKHHVSRCPTCSANVLSRDVCTHLKSRCTTLVLHTAPDAPQGTNNDENSHFVALERRVEQRVRELDVRLAQLSLENGSHNDKLVEVCHSINYLKEAQAGQFGALAEKFERASWQIGSEKRIEERVGELDAKLAQLSLDSGSQSDKIVDVSRHINNLKDALTQQFGPASDRNAAEIKALCTEKSQSLMTAIQSVLTSAPNDPKTHQWVLKGYAALKEEALNSGWSRSMSDKVYLRRYLISWGIHFAKEGDSVKLLLCIQLHEGREDDFLEWPFGKELKLSIIHPETRNELHRIERTAAFVGKFRDSFCRPMDSSNTPIHFYGTMVELADIERDGFVNRDQLLLRFEVLV
ncbi:hypothetical protein HPB48_021373 [Haemaphysalis longicornis]|uniref:TRAF1-6 MATH domain-containing protein n=1 Tax=Haemaphysalis longicornis TaxID=44386 RepID=A0A9J6FHM0_HAELO|nr:hypothetical protein HPB48_021373 [Haemaphysalis longicornis]